MKRVTVSALVALSILLTCAYQVDAKAAPKYTITDRQTALRQKVAGGIKKNELTAKEADNLNGRLNDLDVAIAKMKTKNNGQLSYKDQGKVEKKLNGISLDLQKYQLAKRVVAH